MSNDSLRRKILIIHHGEGIGGALTALIRLIDDLKSEYSITVLCIFESEAVEALKSRGIDVIFPESIFYRKLYKIFVFSEAYFPAPLPSLRRIYTFILALMNYMYFAPREYRKLSATYYCIYLNSLFLWDWLPRSKADGIKFVMHVREPLAKGVLGLRRGLIRRAIARSANVIVAVSDDNASRLGISDRIYRTYDPIDRAKIRKLAVADQGFDPGATDNFDPCYNYFVYVGGSQRIKGFELLINALPYLRDDIRIFFLGYTHELDRLNSLVSRIRALAPGYPRRLRKLRGLFLESDKLIRIGITENPEFYYRKSIALIAPHAVPHACLPIWECMALGIPAIATDVDGMREFVSPDTGIIVRNGSPRALAEAINYAASWDQFVNDRFARQCMDRIVRAHASNADIKSLIKLLSDSEPTEISR